MVLTVSFVLSSATNSFLSPSPSGLTATSPGWAGFASARLSISNGCQDHTTSPYAATSNQSSQRTMCCPPNFGEGVEAPFVCALVARSRETALRTNLRANAAASTASHPAFVTTAKRPSCRERTGRAGRTDLPDGESEMFFAKGLDDPNQIEIIAINRSGRNSLIARSGRIAAKKQPGVRYTCMARR